MIAPANLTTQTLTSGIEVAASYISGKLTSAAGGQTPAEKQDPVAALENAGT